MKIKPYTALISTQRHRLSSYSGRSIIVESESDRGRVVFSNSFRRLQQKAQVFPLESNAAVRNRLTHSLEVAHIGKYLAQRIYSVLKEKDPKFLNCGLENLEIPFVNIVETACLIHDIGNPPFGHFGEVAICDWFSKNGKKCLEKALKKSRNKTKQKNSYLKNEYFDFIKKIR
jgi:dGTPase